MITVEFGSPLNALVVKHQRENAAWHNWHTECKERCCLLAMKLASIHFRLLIAALGATAASVCFGQTDAKAADQKAAASQAKKASAAGSELQRLLDQLAKTREDAIKNSEKLTRDLSKATEAQKKEILTAMEANRKAFEEASSAFMKQINDERRKQRAATKR